MIWNPVIHIQHALAKTKTVSGKIALVLFYTLIWFTILASAYSMYDPTSLGAECLVDAMGDSATAKTIAMSMIRGGNVMVIGFYLYADTGGLTVKNTALVAIINVLYNLCFYLPLKEIVKEINCEGFEYWWVTPVWAVLAAVFTILDYKLGDHHGDDHDDDYEQLNG
mmetsp:Transcript_3542/g.5140  ORF Transcript_3542/g.5140 Transcript_3542/m.5140 type:complete len:167 (+) Transcript_3542:116-616(+)